MRRLNTLILSTGLAVSILFAARPGRATDEGPALSLSALAVGPDDSARPGRGRTGSVNIVIERWSASAADGSTERVGVVRSGSRIVAEIQHATLEVDSKTKTRRIVITTDRPVGAWELGPEAAPTDGAPSPAPESATFDIRISKYGTGEGRLVPSSGSMASSGDSRSDAPYSLQPIRLAAVSVDLKDTYLRAY